MLPRLFLHLTLFYGLLVYAQSSLQLGYIPIAVKTPYFHGWIKGNGGRSPEGTWPNFVSNDREFGWNGIVRVDKNGYQWMGNAPGFNFSKTVTSEITPTKSIFRVEAGPIQFNVTFLSPVEPDDYTRQSIPFTYMYIDAITANDSRPHTVQVYSDVSAQWVTKADSTPVEWNTTVADNITYHLFTRRDPAPMVEVNGIAQDITGYYVTHKRSGLTWQTGADFICRGNFVKNGTLPNTSDPRFRTVSDTWPVFSYSVDLGRISPGDHPEPIVWALGLVRDPLVSFATDQLIQSRSAYYWSKYLSIEEVMSDFLDDFSGAVNRSSILDNKVLSAAPTPEYAGILSLVTRQIFASMDITIPSARPGQFNNTDVKIFMKDIGVSSRASPVEVIYGALPALIFFNPFLARDLLQPLLDFQSSPNYPNPYAAPDLGASYPFVRGNTTNTLPLAVESCGNMLVMAYAQAAKSGDGTLVSHYYPLLQRWADFLVGNALHPRGFIAADGANSTDMSNLALKGILGVYSMAKITEALGGSNTTYTDRANELISDWKKLAITTDGHIQAVYGQPDSWSLMYNIFPAVWLKTGLVGDTILEHQAQFYAQQIPPQFGLNLDNSRPDIAFPHWTLMAAATIPDSLVATRDRLISSTYQRAYKPDVIFPLPVAYKPSSGEAISGNGSPALGAAFAIAAMSIQNTDIKGPKISSPSVHKKKVVSAAIGGVLGGLAFLLFVATGIFLFWRRRNQQQGTTAILEEEPYTSGPLASVRYNNTTSNMAQVSKRAIMGGQQTLDTLNFPHPRSPFDIHPHLMLSPLRAAPVPPVPAQATMYGKHRDVLSLPPVHTSLQSESTISSVSNSNAAPGPGAVGLRAEFEQLRREMESIRHITDAPPGYT